MYNYDLEAIYSSWLRTIEDNQGADGDVPVVSPGERPRNGRPSCNDIAWTSAFPQIASFVAAYYGSTGAAERQWSSLTKYADNLLGHAKGSHGVATCDQVRPSWIHPSCVVKLDSSSVVDVVLTRDDLGPVNDVCSLWTGSLLESVSLGCAPQCLALNASPVDAQWGRRWPAFPLCKHCVRWRPWQSDWATRSTHQRTRPQQPMRPVGFTLCFGTTRADRMAAITVGSRCSAFQR
jgi:hypothetical protein